MFIEITANLSDAQLNHLFSLAMMNLGIRPALGNELWFEVKNPHIDLLNGEELLASTKHQLEKQFGVKIPSLSCQSIAIKKMAPPSPMTLNAATNALLAEHFLQYVELVPENPFAKRLMDKIVDVWRLSGFPSIKDAAVAESFNNESRFAQLNIIAMALNKLGQHPMLPNESWHPVSNPVIPGLDDDAHIQAVAKRLQLNHGVNIQIPSRRFQMKEWGLSEGDA